jgi:hypothetical protein
MPTSFSDTEIYRESCRLAATDPELFACFRQLDYITRIIEPWETGGGDDQMAILSKELIDDLQLQSGFWEDWVRCLPNDQVGMPRFITLPGLGEVSPYTLRYLKIAYDLRSLFGSLDGLDIVELGGGFGGQCAVLTRLFKWRSYTLIDLPEVLLLAEKYLKTLGINSVQFAKDETQVGANPIGLFLSNYAYSELNLELRLRYRDSLMMRAERGFMLWNLLYFEIQRANGDRSRGLYNNETELEELFARVKNGRFGDDMLQSNDAHYGNQLVIWGG